MADDTRRNGGYIDEIEEDEYDDLIEESNAVIAGRAGANLLRKIGEGLKKFIYKAAAFTGGLVKSFLFGEPNPQANFWDTVQKYMNSKTYPEAPTSANDHSPNRERMNQTLEKNERTTSKSEQGPSQSQITPHNTSQDVSAEADEIPLEDPPANRPLDNKETINKSLITLGFGGYITDDKLNIAAIDEQGNIDSNIYTADTKAFNEKSDPQSLAAAIFQIEHENIAEDPDSFDIKEFDDAVMSSNMKAAIISLNMTGNATIEGTMQTTMGSLAYSAHIDGDINAPSTSYQFTIDGKEISIPANKDINQEIANAIQDFRENPPQHSFTIEERKGKEIQVDWERGNPEFFVKVVIDGETKHEDSYVATESPSNRGKGDTKTLANFVYDLGHGDKSKVPEWSAHDLPADEKSTWISSTAAAYTIAGIVNPSGTPSISGKEPDKFFSLIHAGKSQYIDANTAHMAIDFSKGEPKLVANHAAYGYLYMDINTQNPTETAKDIEELRRIIVKTDPSEEFPILSPQDGRSPAGCIVESMQSKSPEITSPVMLSMIGGQICTEASMYIDEHQSKSPIEQSIEDAAETTEECEESQDISEEDLKDEGLSDEEFARKTEEFLANTFKVVGQDETEPDDPETSESDALFEYDDDSLNL